MNACTCTYSLGNTGTPGCVPLMQVQKRVIAVPTYQEDGSYNEIDLTDTIDSAYITALLNNSDATVRWRPLPEMKNVETTRGETNKQTFNDGSSVVLSQGARTYTALIPGQGPVLLGQLEGYSCASVSLYFVDSAGNLIGDGVSNPGFLRPVKIADNTWDPTWTMPTDTSISAITLNFEFDQTINDSDLRMIEAGDITGVSLLSIRGLIDLLGTVVSASVTAVVVDIYSRYGSLLSPDPIEGLLTADFGNGTVSQNIYQTNTTAAWLQATVVESTSIPGRYTITFAVSQTIADVMMIAVKKNGYDDTLLRLELATLA